MKTKSIFWTSFVAAILYLFAQAVYAQENSQSPSFKSVPHKASIEPSNSQPSGDVESRIESLSGINLFPNRKTGNFSLRFSQSLKDSARMQLKTDTDRLLYAQAFSPAEVPMAKPVNVGKLASGIYLIEVRSANTVYWKKVRVRN